MLEDEVPNLVLTSIELLPIPKSCLSPNGPLQKDNAVEC